ncbi:S10 family peptidase [Streptomyces sp. SCA3-4]|uniref:S10 family peptidase n=1 Tax=Streptomyces sichuanensis TaxID=2871810 RepID=UPI001CE32FB8|nr:S10 family peptidase [Streptomyces sichuanensis]MCA6091103.1 S10 family peptidase [Streptomyces sichuanensis]
MSSTKKAETSTSTTCDAGTTCPWGRYAPTSKAWRNAPRLIWTQAQGKPKGFVRRLRNLTQVSLPDSGHQVPAFQPQICREMLYNWLFDRPFPGYDPQHLLKQCHRNGNAGLRKA